MPSIIYDVAVSIDGYINGPGGDISAFAQDGPVVDDYLKRLSSYTCAIMGRATYEFGYRFGLQPGENPYPHMDTYVFSNSMSLPDDSNINVIGKNSDAALSELKAQRDGSIYLCGGGAFAGSLLASGLIDIVRLKRAPVFLGGGTKLFGDNAGSVPMTCVESKLYEGGYLFQEFRL